MNSDAFLRTVFDSFDVGYRRASRAPMGVMPIYRSYRADSGEGTYPVFGDVYDAEEFTGTVDFVRLREYDQTLKNKSWGPPGIEYDRTDVERDRIGGLADRMYRQVDALMRVPTLQIFRSIQDAFTANAYDGNTFFDGTTAAPRGPNVIWGDYSGTKVENAWNQARDVMLNMLTDTGRLINVAPDTVICHPARESEWRKLAESTAPPSGSHEGISNVVGNWINRVIAPPHLFQRDGAVWDPASITVGSTARDVTAANNERIAIALYTGDPVLKPFVWQFEMLKRSEGRPTGERIVGGRYRCEVDTTQLVRTRKYAIACETRGVAGYGLPQYAVLILSSA